MLDFLGSTVGQLTLWMSILAFLVALSLIVVRRVRDQTVGNRSDTSDLLANFQDLNQQGEFSDAEFRKIKSVLGDKLQRDIKKGKSKL